MSREIDVPVFVGDRLLNFIGFCGHFADEFLCVISNL
jgi:hypothetical protein